MRTSVGWAKVVAMDGENARVRMELVLERGREPIRGWVEIGGSRRSFAGWIDLAGTLERARGVTHTTERPGDAAGAHDAAPLECDEIDRGGGTRP